MFDDASLFLLFRSNPKTSDFTVFFFKKLLMGVVVIGFESFKEVHNSMFCSYFVKGFQFHKEFLVLTRYALYLCSINY